MANRHWVGGTGNWNNSNTTSWSTSSGGAGGASIPGTGDVAIFDASSGGGTVTVDSPNGAGVVTVQQITCGAFTGTLDFSANNNNVTLTANGFNGSGTGTRTINLGSGTWTLNVTTTGSISVWDLTTITNLTFSGANASIVISGACADSRNFIGGGRTYGAFTLSTNSSRGPIQFVGNNTFASWSIAAGSTLVFSGNTTQTITAGFTLTGTQSLPIALLSGQLNQTTTLSLGGTCTIDWGAVYKMTKSGAGSLTVRNGLDLGANTSITITPPRVRKVIGG